MATEVERAIPQPRPHHRRWADLILWRVGLGLLLAPMVPFALATFVIDFLSNGFVLHEFLGFIGVLLGLATGWSLIAGFGYLLAVVRRRGSMGRTECMMLGIGIAFTLPLAVVTPLVLAPQNILAYLGLGNPGRIDEVLPYCLGTGLFLTPFGLFGGWILWRIAVRPAPLSMPDLAPVFD